MFIVEDLILTQKGLVWYTVVTGLDTQHCVMGVVDVVLLLSNL